MYIETKKEVKKNMFKSGIKYVPDSSVKTDKKSKIRHQIEKEVFDINDSVADNTKLIKLLFILISKIQDKKLTDKDKKLVNNILKEFDSDELFNIKEVKKLSERQKRIDKIVKG